MGHRRLTKMRMLIGSIGAVAVAATMVLAMAGSGAGANATARTVQHLRPQGSARSDISAPPGSITAFAQEFATNTSYFCPGDGNQPCDGNPNPNPIYSDYGTIDRVSSNYNNGGYGNYAPETAALHGSWMAVVSGDADGNQGVGCPEPSVGEYCTGPYALFGSGASAGSYSVFPAGGFTVTDDLYLSPSSPMTNGTLVDDDVELNNSSGTYGIDNVITACFETNGFVLNFGNGSPGSCSGTSTITTDGWYRFVFVFTDVAGDAYLTESVVSENGLTVEATTGAQPVSGTPTPVYQWGGPGYFWLPTEDISGLPLANFALQLGQHPDGHTP
ncbi:MAG: hypothetical protein ABSH30_18425 [Acidimicrobiales bacterium]